MDEPTAPESAIRYVKVTIGDDGLGYFTTMYGNHEKGSRSEGLGSKDRSAHANLKEAVEAATRDYPGVEIRVEELP